MQELFVQLIERIVSSAERTVIYRLIRSPRHVRHFASDPIPTDTLQRILDAAWYGTSVGGLAPEQPMLIPSSALCAAITAIMMCGDGCARSSRLPRLLSTIMATLNIRDRSRGMTSRTRGSCAGRLCRRSVPRRRLTCGIALSP